MPNYEGDCSAVGEFLSKDSIVAVAAPDKHSDTLWFILVDEVEKT